MEVNRRELLRGLSLTGVVGAAGCSVPSDSDPTPGSDGEPTETVIQGDDDLTIELERVAEGFTSPTQLVVDPSDGTLYVLDQIGTAFEIGPDGRAADPYLDLRDRILVSSERGLLGMAFHPDYPDDPRVFLRYSVPRREGTPEDYSHTEVLTEVRAPSDAESPRMDTERTLMEFPSPTIYHQAGTVLFGPDGYLYVAMGEGTEKQFAQDVRTNLLGGIHRIDVDGSTDDRPYGIPEDNPLVGTEGRPEYYAWGFRNPWRMSFNDGDLIVGDVGEGRWEEVDVVEKGGNYGWPYREGAHCTGWDDSPGSGADCGVDLSTVPGDEFIDPVTEFPRSADDDIFGTAVIAGYVYGRDDIPGIRGQYVFSNYTSDLEEPQGDLFVADPTAEGQWPISKLTIGNGPNGDVNRVVNSLGRDADGRIYLLAVRVPDKDDRFAHEAGEILRIVPEGVADPLPPA